jgi:hypothetical protein
LYDSCNMNSMMIGDSAFFFFSSLVKLGIIHRPGMFLWMWPVCQRALHVVSDKFCAGESASR